MSSVQKILFAYTNDTLDVSTETNTGSISVMKDTFVGIGNSLACNHVHECSLVMRKSNNYNLKEQPCNLIIGKHETGGAKKDELGNISSINTYHKRILLYTVTLSSY